MHYGRRHTIRGKATLSTDIWMSLTCGSRLVWHCGPQSFLDDKLHPKYSYLLHVWFVKYNLKQCIFRFLLNKELKTFNTSTVIFSRGRGKSYLKKSLWPIENSVTTHFWVPNHSLRTTALGDGKKHDRKHTALTTLKPHITLLVMTFCLWGQCAVSLHPLETQCSS